MRINKYIASHTTLSRRKVDTLILNECILVNNFPATIGLNVKKDDIITIKTNNETITLTVAEEKAPPLLVALHKPPGYVCSRNGQGSSTIYDLLPPELHHLKPIGRLDKDSSGLLLLTNNGDLHFQLAHPSFGKQKIYDITLTTSLAPLHRQMIVENGVLVDGYLSKFFIERRNEQNDTVWRVRLSEGKNRQIRKTFAALGYTVCVLHRIQFGPYMLRDLKVGAYQNIVT